MQRWLLFVLFVTLAGALFAAHDFTINGEVETWVSLGDTLFLQFSFEEAGAGANIAVTISAAGFDIPIYESTEPALFDGLAPDETDVDGVFEMHLPVNFSFPEAASLILTVSDGGVEDSAILHFEQLDSTFYLYGNVLQEAGWIDLPVPAALVYTFYNASIEEITDMLENFEIDVFIEWLTQDHYFLSEMTGLLGNYELYVPDAIPNVECTVGVYSAVDLAGNMVAPQAQSVEVNGAANVDFLYLEPDGYLEGEVTNDQGEIVTQALLTLTQSADPEFFQMVTIDSLGQFSVPMLNGDYTLDAYAVDYDAWTQDFTINNDDVWIDVELEALASWVLLETTVSDQDGAPVEGATLDMIWVDYPQIVYSDTSDETGALSIECPFGEFDMELYYGGEIVWTSNIIVDEDTILEPIVLNFSATDSDASPLCATQVYPNPFNPTTTVSFSLAQPGDVRVEVFDIRGRKVCTLQDGAMPSGDHALTWAGRTDDGASAASGVYFFRIQAAGRTEMRKAVLLK